MDITKKWLEEHNFYSSTIKEILLLSKSESKEEIHIINLLIKHNKFNWANWYITERLNKIRKVKYAVYAAEIVLPIFEKKYQKDKRPRLAIKAAKVYIKNPCKRTIENAYVAANAAYDATNYTTTANAVYDTAYAAAYAADAVCNGATTYAEAAYDAAADADAAIKIKIIEYGIKLIKEMQNKERK